MADPTIVAGALIGGGLILGGGAIGAGIGDEGPAGEMAVEDGHGLLRVLCKKRD